MASINKTVPLKFNGETYSIRADFELVEKIEQRIGLGTLSQRLVGGDIRVSDLAWVVFSALSANGEGAAYRQCGEHVIANIPAAAEFCGKLIEEILSAGPEEPLDDDGAPKKPGKRK